MHVDIVTQELLAAGLDAAVRTEADGYHTVDDRPILAVAVNAINQQSRLIDEQRASIAALQATTVALQKMVIEQQSALQKLLQHHQPLAQGAMQ